MNSKYPIPAFRIFSTGNSWCVCRVSVFAVQGGRAWFYYDWTPSKPPMRIECAVTELASTRHKALKRLNQILTAMEPRPATPPVAQGQPPEGMTGSSAAPTSAGVPTPQGTGVKFLPPAAPSSPATATQTTTTP